jgi:hypothetical protein
MMAQAGSGGPTEREAEVLERETQALSSLSGRLQKRVEPLGKRDGWARRIETPQPPHEQVKSNDVVPKRKVAWSASVRTMDARRWVTTLWTCRRGLRRTRDERHAVIRAYQIINCKIAEQCGECERGHGLEPR